MIAEISFNYVTGPFSLLAYMFLSTPAVSGSIFLRRFVTFLGQCGYYLKQFILVVTESTQSEINVALKGLTKRKSYKIPLGKKRLRKIPTYVMKTELTHL